VHQLLGARRYRLVMDDKVAQYSAFEIVEIVEDGFGVAIALLGRDVADHGIFQYG